jgi:hypothetical protein
MIILNIDLIFIQKLKRKGNRILNLLNNLYKKIIFEDKIDFY